MSAYVCTLCKFERLKAKVDMAYLKAEVVTSFVNSVKLLFLLLTKTIQKYSAGMIILRIIESPTKLLTCWCSVLGLF
jgi:hypothetical protein